MAQSTSQTEPLINDNPQLQSYYGSLESRIGYKLFLGDTRHFGYYEHDTYWPFPVTRALRRMEDKLAEALQLPAGSRLLDAGCGVGHVALRLAKQHGFRVQGVDVIDHHLAKARRNIVRARIPQDQVEVRKMDYHHLESLGSGTFDGIYTSETFVHATDPKAVLKGFYNLLRPGGRLALFEYDHQDPKEAPDDLVAIGLKINEYAALPTNTLSCTGVFKTMLEEVGFTDIEVRDYTQNIKPMTRLFYVVAFIPWIFITLLHLEKYFINTVSGVMGHRALGRWRFVAISATKPATTELSKTS